MEEESAGIFQGMAGGSCMTWIHDVYRDEIRAGFLVTAHRKRIWDIELMMLAELERVCAKYGLSYYADLGTLLGAGASSGVHSVG